MCDLKELVDDLRLEKVPETDDGSPGVNELDNVIECDGDALVGDLQKTIIEGKLRFLTLKY